MVAYMVYTDYQEERVMPEQVEYFIKPEDALRRVNEMRDELLKSEKWTIFNEEDAGEITLTNAYIIFVDEKTSLEAYVVISTFTLK